MIGSTLRRVRQSWRLLPTLMATVTMVVSPVLSPATASAAPAPASCQDIRSANPSAGDGNYTIHPNGMTFTVYCHDMAGTPRDYLSLVNTGGSSNFSQYTAGGAASGSNVRTYFTKIRLDPSALLVDIDDLTFSTSSGLLFHGGNPITSVPYSVALDCRGGGSRTGMANIDLTGTPFAVDDVFFTHGFIPGGTVTANSGTTQLNFNGASVAANSQVVGINGGGFCGGTGPSGANSNIFAWVRSAPSPKPALNLQYLGPIDNLAPTTTATVSPAANGVGWHNTAPTIALSATDDPGGVGVDSITYSASGAQTIASTTAPGASAPVVISAEGTTTLTFAATDAAGNVEVAQTVTVKVDTTAPVVTATTSPAANAHGWNNTDVTVTGSGTDAGSGVQSCTTATVSAEGAAQSATVSCTDVAGNTGSATATGINIDKTNPTVTYGGNAGTYTVDQTVSITCTAADALSGIAADTCQNASGDAYTFALGANTLSATATDNADNQDNGSTTFTVQVTYGSLCSLVERFSSNRGIANSLCAKLRAAEASDQRGNANAKRGQLQAFKNELAAQSGKALTADEANVLTQLANTL